MLGRLVLIGAALAALTLPTTAYAGETADPMAGAPAVGDCFDITYAQGMKTSLHGEDPVDCAGDHTAVVAAVGKLPGRLDWDSPKAKIYRATGKVCASAFHDLTGNDTLLWQRSQYAYWQFWPTKSQQADGARWFDCMVSIKGARDLNALPDTLPHLSRHMPDSVARCVTRTNGYTTCAEAHRWRATFSFYAHGKATRKHLNAAANRRCPAHVSGPGWLTSAYDVAGKRFVVVCYDKTRQ
ncbi:septum formation family protein [Nocardioides mangrovi]|uniref:Septum formation family protein n=1 Tax=Nocardioides mangrovi TaxID=2874580 RepID=A0ABS7UBQ9_9ACTN|nr:septum formation family protein [Nocardioides mangrovi]MBZ5738315.1 septum formation family protein [Nocardioides mangrovi]